jgi:hypothetical protein
MLHLMIDSPDQFPAADPPDWLMAWQKEVKKRFELQRRRDTAVPPPHHQQKRLAAIQSGLNELELWLHDLVRNGLAAARHKPRHYWFRMADRMIDAQANRISAEIRKLASLPTDDPQWAETILRRIGRLNLLIQGFRQFETLPLTTQIDLQMAVGWLPRGEALNPRPGMADQWHILGQENEQTGQRHTQRTWLWGEQSNRAAQISTVVHGQRYKDFSLVAGIVLDAELRFNTGAVPIQAQITARNGSHQPNKPAAGYSSLADALAAFNQGVAANPWLTQFPMLVTAVPIHDGGQWSVRDESGTNLLLPTHYKGGWHLLALSGGRPLPIFGVFNGDVLNPLSVWHDGRYLPLHILRGVS